VRDNDTVNRPVRTNGNIVNDPVNRVTQKFEAGDERNIEFGGGKFIAQRRRMIEVHLTFPAVNERAGVEIFYATDAEHSVPGGRALSFTHRPVLARWGDRLRSCHSDAGNSCHAAPVRDPLRGLHVREQPPSVAAE
jgi:hypothetical protein